jgi:hypothetical protein
MSPPDDPRPAAAHDEDRDHDHDEEHVELGPADDGMAPLVTNTGDDAEAGDDADASTG